MDEDFKKDILRYSKKISFNPEHYKKSEKKNKSKS